MISCICTYCENAFFRKVSQVTKYKFNYCSKDCYYNHSKTRKQDGRFEQKYVNQIKDTSLLCIGCEEYKEDLQFHKNNNYNFRRDRSYYCKECTKGKSKVEYKNTRINKLKYLNTLEGFLKSLLQHTKTRKKENNINYEYLLDIYNRQDGNCSLSGIKMTTISGNGKINTNISIDRIDSSKGYIIGNIQLVCTIVNTMKTNLKQEDFLNWCNLIIVNNYEKNIC